MKLVHQQSPINDAGPSMRDFDEVSTQSLQDINNLCCHPEGDREAIAVVTQMSCLILQACSYGLVLLYCSIISECSALWPVGLYFWREYCYCVINNL